MAVSVYFGSSDRQVHPRQNLADKILPTQNAPVGEEREPAGLRIAGNATPREFLVLAAGDTPTFHKLVPIRNVVALVDCEVNETTCFGERGGINPELVADEVDDADVRRDRLVCSSG